MVYDALLAFALIVLVAAVFARREASLLPAIGLYTATTIHLVPHAPERVPLAFAAALAVSAIAMLVRLWTLRGQWMPQSDDFRIT